MAFDLHPVAAVLLSLVGIYLKVAVFASGYILLRWFARDPNWQGHTVFRKPWVLLQLLTFYWPVALYTVLSLDLKHWRYKRRLDRLERKLKIR